jgi:hypothetical protein
VLQGLEVGVLESEERTRGFFGFVTSADIDEEAYIIR